MKSSIKAMGLVIGAGAALSIAALLHAAPTADDAGLRVDITSPADRSRAAWDSQVRYSVTVSYDGKSTEYDEIPRNAVLARTMLLPDADAAPAIGDGVPPALVEMTRSNCMGCHDFAASSAGPSFAAIAGRYAGRASAVSVLAGHITDGSSGSWGGGRMPPHPDLNSAQATAIAQWILAHGNDPAVRYHGGNEGSFRMPAPANAGPRAGVVLTAFYTGPLKKGDTRGPVAGQDRVVVYGTSGS